MKHTADYYLLVDQSLRNFAKNLGLAFGGVEFQYRENEKYVNGEYFQAVDEDLELNLSYVSDLRAKDYRFWLHVSWSSQEPRDQFLPAFEKTLFLGLEKFQPQIAWIEELGKRHQKVIEIFLEDVVSQNESAEEDFESESSEGDDSNHIEGEFAESQDRFAVLQVVDIQSLGAFLDWGQPKDLLLPENEQTRPLKIGQDVLVCIYKDKQDRPIASMRLNRHLSKEPPQYKENQEVDLIITAKTDLGYKAVINQSHWGMLYLDEVFQPLHYGQRTKGYIKKVREDFKIDLLLQAPGHKAAQTEIGPKILSQLENANGFLSINDKTSADQIYELFGVSKKKYKIALGDLYKKRLISVDDKGIRLLKK